MRTERRVFVDHNKEGEWGEWCPESHCLADDDEEVQRCPSCGQMMRTTGWVDTTRAGSVDMKGGGR